MIRIRRTVSPSKNSLRYIKYIFMVVKRINSSVSTRESPAMSFSKMA